LYKGFLPTVFRETPGFGIYFTTYNYLKNNNNANNNANNYLNTFILNTFIFGALSGLSAWIFIYPSDLIKTKYQAQNSTSLLNIIHNIWQENNINNNFIRGLSNYYKGFNLAIMRALPLHGGVFLGYEVSKKYI
jgi:solute carrier family 25 carnitine/acylcarnitine transporter 20/29